MDKSVSIYTYSQHRELFAISGALGQPAFRATQLYRSFSPKYVTRLIDIAHTEWVVHCDEDAFLLRPESVHETIEFMAKNGYACCGMPDGGMVKIRTHNPIACNPFFLILHRSALYPKYEAEADIYSNVWEPSYEAYTSDAVRQSGLPFKYDDYEPYYPFFYWLLKHKFKILYLAASEWEKEPEGISTILYDTNNLPFMLHTWYSRYFMKTEYRSRLIGNIPILRRLAHRRSPGDHYERIMRAVEYAKSIKQRHAQ